MIHFIPASVNSILVRIRILWFTSLFTYLTIIIFFKIFSKSYFFGVKFLNKAICNSNLVKLLLSYKKIGIKKVSVKKRSFSKKDLFWKMPMFCWCEFTPVCRLSVKVWLKKILGNLDLILRTSSRSIKVTTFFLPNNWATFIFFYIFSRFLKV